MKNDELLKKWLFENLTASELEAFKNSDDYDLNIKILEKAAHFDVPKDAIVKDFEQFKEASNKGSIKPGGFSPLKMLYRIAAILVIALGVYFGFIYQTNNIIKTLASQKTTFELPDASSVVLNAASEVSYNKKSWANNREISLEGEAFFKVSKGSKFDVITSIGTVSVLGTQFSVKHREDYFEVKCYEGLVSVDSKGQAHKLTKGATYRILNGTVAVDSTIKKQPAWIGNSSSFKSVPLAHVIKEFERQYAVVIITEDIELQRLFTGGFVHNNIDEALKSISVPFNLTYTKENPEKIILYKSPQ